MSIIELIGAILGSSAVTGIITAIVTRRKSMAEAKQVEVTSQIDLAKAAMEYSDRIEKSFVNRLNDLTQEICNLKAENVQLRIKIEELIKENNSLRIEISKLTNKE